MKVKTYGPYYSRFLCSLAYFNSTDCLHNTGRMGDPAIDGKAYILCLSVCVSICLPASFLLWFRDGDDDPFCSY